MMKYICKACKLDQHDLCAGTDKPRPGVMGGKECVCECTEELVDEEIKPPTKGGRRSLMPIELL